MNGRASRRIHRAALHVMLVGIGMGPSMGGTTREIAKTLKRQYKARPYHKRTGIGYTVLTHKGQERRWWGVRQEQVPRPTPRKKPEPYVEPDFYDDHSRFKSLR